MKNNTKTIHIDTPENRKVLYYLKGQNYNNIAKIISIDEVEDRKYEAQFEFKGENLSSVFNGDNKVGLKDALSYLIQMSEALRLMHGGEEPVALSGLELSDFVLDESGVKYIGLEKLIWAEPEYVAANIRSYLDIVKGLIDSINFDGERNINHLKEMPDLRFRTMDLVKLELQRIYKSCFKPYNPNLPVGFRSGVVKNNVAGVLAYFVSLNIALRFDFGKYTTLNKGVCSAALFFILVITIFFAGNYKGVLDVFKVNKIKNKYVKYGTIGLLSAVLLAVLLFVFFMAIKLA